MTENGNVVGEITLAGTIALMVFAGLSSTVFGTGAFVVARPWLPRGTVARGLVFGAFLLALIGRRGGRQANADFVILGDRLLNVAMFSALFLAFGLVASSAIAVLDRRVPPAASLSPRMWALTAVCALPVVPGVLGVAFAFALAARAAADRRLARDVRGLRRRPARTARARAADPGRRDRRHARGRRDSPARSTSTA